MQSVGWQWKARQAGIFRHLNQAGGSSALVCKNFLYSPRMLEEICRNDINTMQLKSSLGAAICSLATRKLANRSVALPSVADVLAGRVYSGEKTWSLQSVECSLDLLHGRAYD